MSFVKHKVRIEEHFKDGNILDGREFHPGEIAVLDESDVLKIVQSGGTVTQLGTVVPNPKPEKSDEPVEAVPEKVSGKDVRKTKG